MTAISTPSVLLSSLSLIFDTFCLFPRFPSPLPHLYTVYAIIYPVTQLPRYNGHYLSQSTFNPRAPSNLDRTTYDIPWPRPPRPIYQPIFHLPPSTSLLCIHWLPRLLGRPGKDNHRLPRPAFGSPSLTASISRPSRPSIFVSPLGSGHWTESHSPSPSEYSSPATIRIRLDTLPLASSRLVGLCSLWHTVVDCLRPLTPNYMLDSSIVSLSIFSQNSPLLNILLIDTTFALARLFESRALAIHLCALQHSDKTIILDCNYRIIPYRPISSATN